MLRQLVLASFLHGVYEFYVWVSRGSRFYDSVGVKSLKNQMSEAKNFNSWRRLAVALDTLEGNDAWKAEKESPVYDYKRIDHRISLYKAIILCLTCLERFKPTLYAFTAIPRA